MLETASVTQTNEEWKVKRGRQRRECWRGALSGVVSASVRALSLVCPSQSSRTSPDPAAYPPLAETPSR